MKILLFVLAVGMGMQSVAQNQATSGTKQPFRIAVIIRPAAPMTTDEVELIRSKLISSLVRKCEGSCVVAEQAWDDDSKVDAILTGSAVIQNQCYNCAPRMQGAMRLVAKDGTVLWSDTVYSSAFTRSVTSSFADNVAKKLVSQLRETGGPSKANAN
jgi:hypothetical protein